MNGRGPFVVLVLTPIACLKEISPKVKNVNGILACGQSVPFTATHHISQIDFSGLNSACQIMRILECQRAHLGAGADGRKRRPIVEFPNPNGLPVAAKDVEATMQATDRIPKDRVKLLGPKENL